MSETTDEFITAGWIYAKPIAWMGRKAYRGAQRAGIAYQNWRWGGAGGDGSSAPATTSGASPGGTGGSKWSTGGSKWSTGGSKWSTIEQHEEETMTYTRTTDTKWTK